MFNNQITKERNKDLLDAYYKKLRELGLSALHKKRITLIDEIINLDAPKFYISEGEAQRAISKMLRGIPLNNKNPLKNEMYEELKKNFLEWRKENPDTSISKGVEYIINLPAPKFYIKPQSAHILICKLMRNKTTKK